MVNNLDHTVSVIDTLSNSVISVVYVSQNPLGIAITPDNAKAYVANQAENTLSVIDVSSDIVIGTISIILPMQ